MATRAHSWNVEADALATGIEFVRSWNVEADTLATGVIFVRSWNVEADTLATGVIFVRSWNVEIEYDPTPAERGNGLAQSVPAPGMSGTLGRARGHLANAASALKRKGGKSC